MIQIGGSDQLGHIDAGYNYIRKKTNRTSAGLCLPLLTDSHGRKLGKTSNDGTKIWLDDKKTSPYAFYQYFRQKPDVEIVPLLRFFLLSYNHYLFSVVLSNNIATNYALIECYRPFIRNFA